MDDHSRPAGKFFVGQRQLGASTVGAPIVGVVIVCVVVICVVLLSQLGGSLAAGPYEGQWDGIATPSRARCNAARVTLMVTGKVVVGEALLAGEKLDIRGTVWEDGSFGATIGFQNLTGRFSGDAFEGGFQSPDCQWKVKLERKK
jgi:hypothetical protein